MANFLCFSQEDEGLAGHLRDGRGRGARLRRGGADHVRPARARQLPRRRRRVVVVPPPRARRQAPPLQPRVRPGRRGRNCLNARRAPARNDDRGRCRRHGHGSLAVGGVERLRRVPRGAVRGPDDRGAAGLRLLHGDFLLVAHASYPFSSSLCSVPVGFGLSVSSA
jgi:hypothetical protein